MHVYAGFVGVGGHEGHRLVDGVEGAEDSDRAIGVSHDDRMLLDDDFICKVLLSLFFFGQVFVI